MNDPRMRYLGVLGLLCECSVHVPEELRESIETALEHACEDGTLRWKRILDRYEIEAVWRRHCVGCLKLVDPDDLENDLCGICTGGETSGP